MFWIRRDKVVVDGVGQLIQADSCPCISDIILARCDKQENGLL